MARPAVLPMNASAITAEPMAYVSTNRSKRIQSVHPVPRPMTVKAVIVRQTVCVPAPQVQPKPTAKLAPQTLNAPAVTAMKAFAQTLRS